MLRLLSLKAVVGVDVDVAWPLDTVPEGVVTLGPLDDREGEVFMVASLALLPEKDISE